jgi:hypothetical protein
VSGGPTGGEFESMGGAAPLQRCRLPRDTDHLERRDVHADVRQAWRDWSSAVGLNQMIFPFARLAGPSLAGAVISLWGLGWCFHLNALSSTAEEIRAGRERTRTESHERCVKLTERRSNARSGRFRSFSGSC